jgi:hypothetical protein
MIAAVSKHRFLLSNWYTKAFFGAVCGYASGVIAGIVAGHVRGGIGLRISFLFHDPLREAVGYFMTMTWLAGLVAFLCLHLVLISGLALTKRFSSRMAL